MNGCQAAAVAALSTVWVLQGLTRELHFNQAVACTFAGIRLEQLMFVLSIVSSDQMLMAAQLLR
jgi:hypothetical protein